MIQCMQLASALFKPPTLFFLLKNHKHRLQAVFGTVQSPFNSHFMTSLTVINFADILYFQKKYIFSQTLLVQFRITKVA